MVVESFKRKAKTRTAIGLNPIRSSGNPVKSLIHFGATPVCAGVREWWKLQGPVLECQACGGLVRSEYLASRGAAEQSAMTCGAGKPNA